MMWKALIISLFLRPQPQAAPKPAPKAEPAAPTQSADDALAKVQAFYVGTKKLKADFKQTYTQPTFGRSSTSTGKVYVSKPGKMRWDYKTPTTKHFISDGTTLWVYEPEAKQAFKQSLGNTLLPVAVTFLYGQGDLKKDFTPSF